MALLTVIESFADFRSGRPEVYNPGRLVDSDDPVVKGRERHFEPADTAAARVRVESATAAPGERRSRSRAPKRAAKKAPAKKAAVKARQSAGGTKTPAKGSQAAQPAPDPASDASEAGGSTGEKL